MFDSACCASVQFAFAPERMPLLVATSRTTWFLLSVQEGTGSAICSTRCDKFLVHSFRLGYQQIGSIIIGSGWIKLYPQTQTFSAGTQTRILRTIGLDRARFFLTQFKTGLKRSIGYTPREAERALIGRWTRTRLMAYHE